MEKTKLVHQREKERERKKERERERESMCVVCVGETACERKGHKAKCTSLRG